MGRMDFSNRRRAVLTLDDGYGRLTRKRGMACDHLLSVNLVTADSLFRVNHNIKPAG